MVKTSKIIAIISIMIILVVSFMLFSNMKLAFSNIPIKGSIQSFSYAYLLTDVALSILLFTIIFMVQNKSINSTPQLSNERNTEDSSITSDVKKKVETIDIEVFKKKVIQGTEKSLTLNKLADKILSNFSKEFPIVTGLVYFRKEKDGDFKAVGEYAFFAEEKPKDFKEGETIPGQVAKNKILLNISNIPDNYIKVGSGLGKGSPKYLLFLPILNEDETIAIFEFASFIKFEKEVEEIFNNLAPSLAECLLKFRK